MTAGDRNSWVRAYAGSTMEHGFTFIEALAALTIFAVVGLAAFAMLSRAVAARTAVQIAHEQLMQTRQALSALASDLASAQHSKLMPFQGAADSVGFIRLRKSSQGGTVLKRIDYFTRPGPDGQSVQLFRSASDFHGGREVELLLPAANSVTFQYLRRDKTSVRWEPQWMGAGGLPEAAGVQIVFAPGQEAVNLVYLVRAHEKTR